MEKYNHKDIEKKWQEKWTKDNTYKTEDSSSKQKMYVLDMFPYPSGEGLHVGHPRGYIATDVYSRMKRMQDFNVLHPMGWDAFGLPAENFAIKNKIHPREAVEKNIARFKEQLSIIGLDYDWSREIDTTDPKFYKWTQWIFLKMFEKGLAYESYEPINWCPSCQTGLANEDVNADGTCERCGTVVEKKPMRQWVLKITDYADRMLADLDKLPKWPEGVKEAQRNWIGKSEGAEIDFFVPNQNEHPIKIFTTRPDTIFGATYIAVSAGLAKKWMDIGWKASKEVADYIEETLKAEKIKDFKEKEKTGISAGFSVTNPATKELIPVWIANYVMSDVGTGAIMAVPAHDERDFEFAKKYNLPIKQVIAPHIIDQGNPPREGKEKSPRNVVQGIVRNLKNDTVLQIVWKDFPWKTFVIGGVEGEESFEEAVEREIREETGYKNFKSIKQLGPEVRSEWYADHKDVNRYAHMRMFEVVLENDEHDELTEEESKKHSLKWVPFSDIQKSFAPVSEMHIIWEALNDGIYGQKAFTDKGMVINSGEFSDISSEIAKQKITEFVGGKMVSTYKIKDWIFSRQRYWGEPIPLIHCEKCGVVAVPEKDLPVLLPNVENYEPSGTGESPLANIADWVNVECPKCGGKGKRETNTMPQWAGSSWYYLRYIDSQNSESLINLKKEKEWMPVDVYVGGDHATRHLIYARFWHKFLFDIGVVSTEEPFPRLEFLGFILAEDGRKMSKRWKNVVNPDEMVERFGADAFRLYEMFIGPFVNAIPWSTDGLVGTRRFLDKVWKTTLLVQNQNSDSTDARIGSLLNQTIKKVEEDIENFKFNTSISSMMIFINELMKTNEELTSSKSKSEQKFAELGVVFLNKSITINDYKKFLKILAPFAPHMTEEIWHELGEKESIHLSSWPDFDESKIIDDMLTIVIQVNGKVRAEINTSLNENEESIKAMALADESVQKWLEGKEPKRVIYIKNKLVNIVV